MRPLALAIGVVLAATANSYLDEGRRLVGELQFEQAIEQLEVARKVPTNDLAQKVEILTLLARCQVAVGKRDEAQASFEEMLALNPAAEIDRGLSPKIVEAFDAAKEHLFAKDYFVMTRADSPAGLAIIQVADPWKRAKAFFFHAREPLGAWVDEEVSPVDGRISVNLAARGAQQLQWYADARDEASSVLGSVGTRDKPQLFSIAPLAAEPLPPPPPPKPRVQRPLAWALVGVGAAALAVGAFFQTQSLADAQAARDSSKPPGDWAYTARDAQSRAVGEATWATALFIGSGVSAGGAVAVFAW